MLSTSEEEYLPFCEIPSTKMYKRVSKYYENQEHPKTCAIASIAIVLSSIHNKRVEETAVVSSSIYESAKLQGLSLKAVHEALKANKVNSSLHYANKSSLNAFRKALSELNKKNYMIVNFSTRELAMIGELVIILQLELIVHQKIFVY